VAADNLAVWNGSAWAEFEGGADDPVYAIGLDSAGDLVVGGAFLNVGSGPTPANRVARWNGSSWSAMSTGVDDDVRALHVTAALDDL